ncbi:hypothetical protein C8Q74DRAFT_1200479 [Fomes fomentarius]|nr:hypothetical protein C8Q74DRAFT_1200479 [Fomes fomentarius]
MGALLIGVIISGMYYYYTRYTSDAWHTKMLVTVVWATDSIHQALISHTIYWYLVKEYGNINALSLLNKTIVTEVLFNGFTGLFVQSFFAVRVYKLSQKKLYAFLPVALLVAAEFGEFRLHTFIDLTTLRGLSISMNVFAAAADVLIAVILCTILHASRSDFSQSNTLINKLASTGSQTSNCYSVCACISLITFFAIPNTFVYIGFYFMIGRLYSNSLMATLNARKSLREGPTNDRALSLRGMQPSNFALSRHGTEGIAIRIETTQDTKRDGADEPDLENDSTVSTATFWAPGD